MDGSAHARQDRADVALVMATDAVLQRALEDGTTDDERVTWPLPTFELRMQRSGLETERLTWQWHLNEPGKEDAHGHTGS